MKALLWGRWSLGGLFGGRLQERALEPQERAFVFVQERALEPQERAFVFVQERALEPQGRALES